jgi:hypothetical protein
MFGVSATVDFGKNQNSTAVDFAKTGVLADFPKDLRIKSYPDFMEGAETFLMEAETVLIEYNAAL